MTILPVVERELRVASRRRATPLVRLAAAAVGLGLTAWVLEVDRDPPQEVGGDLFIYLAVLLFIYAGIIGTQVTADCMTEEKREGTLGLLFLTDLKGYDVVFGKLTATSLHWLYGMLAVVPVLAIPFLLGGVSQAELWRVVLVLLNLLFFSLSIGIWASTVCRRDNRAHGLALIVALAILFAWPAAIHLTQPATTEPRIADLSSPVSGCILAFDGTYNNHEQIHFWINVAVTQFYSWSFLGLACWMAPRCWQDAVVRNPFWLRWQRLLSLQIHDRARWLELNPFLWRASRARFGQMAVWMFLGIAAVLWFWQHGRLHRLGGDVDYFDPPIDIAFLAGCGLIVKAWVSAEAGRALGLDRRSGALELILSTRLRPIEIVRGQLESLWRQFALPIGALLVANLLCLTFEWRVMHKWPLDEDFRLAMVLWHVVVGAFLVLDSIALSWVGMWHGFVARKPNRSVVPAMLRIVVLPSLLFLILMSLYAAGGVGQPDAVIILVFWCILGASADSLAFFSREKLLAQFQTIASEGYVRGRAGAPRTELVPKLAEVS